MKKIMISIDESVLERVDKFVSDNGYNRSTFFTLCANEYMSAKDSYPQVRDDLNKQFADLMSALDKKFK